MIGPAHARWCAGLALLIAGLASAAPPKLTALTKSYAAKNGLPVRIVKNDLGTRQIEREFVPVLAETKDSFLEHFQAAHGAVIWRASADATHVTIGINPTRAHNYEWRAHAIGDLDHQWGGRYLALALDPAEVAHWERWIDTYTPPGSEMYLGGLAFGRVDGYTNFTNAMQKLGQPVYGGCMWWLVHAEISEGLNLATAMGVRRAKGPAVLAPRLVHAGNERVGPVGIAVKSIEEFNAMTDEQLLGPEPAGGAAEQVKP
jgi:hypothetical protein